MMYMGSAMRLFASALLLFSPFTCLSQQAGTLGGPCEGCEAALEFGDQILTDSDTFPEYMRSRNKLVINGVVYQPDGVSPASGVILYAYHTNERGLYSSDPGAEGWARRHGRLRGWLKTDESGCYSIYTIRPASYPDRSEPEHVHFTVLEPGKTPYYIDDVLFTDDPLVTDEVRASQKQRGGPGISTPRRVDGVLYVNRDIYLGKNIPNYTTSSN